MKISTLIHTKESIAYISGNFNQRITPVYVAGRLCWRQIHYLKILIEFAPFSLNNNALGNHLILAQDSWIWDQINQSVAPVNDKSVFTCAGGGIAIIT